MVDRLYFGYDCIYVLGLKNWRRDIYLESGMLISWNSVHENSDKKETEKQHHGDEKKRGDCLLQGFLGV